MNFKVLDDRVHEDNHLKLTHHYQHLIEIKVSLAECHQIYTGCPTS